MAPDNNLPVILLAFANDQGDNSKYLRNPPEEMRQLKTILEKAKEKGLCDFELLSNATLDDITQAEHLLSASLVLTANI